MNWRNNESKGDDYPVYNTAVVAVEDKNIFKIESRTINDSLQSILSNLYGKHS